MKILRKILVLMMCFHKSVISAEIESFLTFSQQLSQLSAKKPSAIVRDVTAINTYEELLEAVKAGSIAQSSDKSAVDAMFGRVCENLDVQFRALLDIDSPTLSLVKAVIELQNAVKDQQALKKAYGDWNKQLNAANSLLPTLQNECKKLSYVLETMKKLFTKLPSTRVGLQAASQWVGEKEEQLQSGFGRFCADTIYKIFVSHLVAAGVKIDAAGKLSLAPLFRRLLGLNDVIVITSKLNSAPVFQEYFKKDFLLKFIKAEIDQEKKVLSLLKTQPLLLQSRLKALKTSLDQLQKIFSESKETKKYIEDVQKRVEELLQKLVNAPPQKSQQPNPPGWKNVLSFESAIHLINLAVDLVPQNKGDFKLSVNTLQELQQVHKDTPSKAKNELRSLIKKAKLILHPDKGGNEEAFKLALPAFEAFDAWFKMQAA